MCCVTQAQYHQLIGSQIGRFRKRQFSVQCTGDPKTAATDSWLENRSNRHTAPALSVTAALLVLIVNSISYKLNLRMCNR